MRRMSDKKSAGKKGKKKLMLNRETLKILTDDQLRVAQGGLIGDSTSISDASHYWTCTCTQG